MQRLVRVLVCGLVWAVALAGAAAQDPLGPSEAQLFDRTLVRSALEVLAPAGAKAPERLSVQSFLDERTPALLLGGELTADGEAMALIPPDMVDVALMLACDRRSLKRGREDYLLPANSSRRGHTVQATFERPEDDGSQVIVATLAPIADGNGNQRAWTGTITVHREWQPEKPLLAGFRATFELETDLSQNERTQHHVHRIKVVAEHAWKHREILDGASPEFRARVYKAITDGGEYLERQLRNPSAGQFAQEEPNSHGTGSGYLALAILTAIKAGVDPAGETLSKAMDELRQREMTNTYCLGTSLMAMEALYAPIGEREALIGGRIDGPMQRHPSESDLLLMQKWSERLLGNIDTTQDSAYVRRFHYHSSTSWDNSNCQYAMLGLYAAQLCGVELSPQVWYASTQHFLQCQRAENLRPLGVNLKTHAEVEKEAKRPSRTVAARRKVEPKGWAYQNGGNATGSMTTAGITGLVIGTSALRHQKKLARKQAAECDIAILSGFAWFAEHLTVRANPTTGHGTGSWHFYYLYGIERAFELGQVARIQGRDWYFEGAAYLLEGHFSRQMAGLDQTCFAVLFLKKAALPVISGR